ncbi:enoyl-CoA hydratase/isomerase family protein [Aliikangiella sp. IMCC44359]|uniref:enoyl-CoA hydratase/isomerase family protein n=1 Tax=Aliikangiella sp. IMCC44359 TaxID=3459125 RepID=UPI00403B32DE
MTTSNIIIEKKTNGVGKITFNKADVHNAFDDSFISELTKGVSQLNEDTSVRVIVLAAKGKSFSAGADLNWMKKMAGYSWEQNYQDSLQLASLMQTIYECEKPTVAIVQGAAFGGGVGLVACCDIALASEKALFCLSEVKLGLIPAVISPYVVKAIGERNAKRYFVTAERFNSNQALSMNLIHSIYPHDQLDTEAEQFINTILSNGPRAILKAKQLINFVQEKPLDEEIIRETAQRIADIRASKEGKEGVSAFLEKRQPKWVVNDNNREQKL